MDTLPTLTSNELLKRQQRAREMLIKGTTVDKEYSDLFEGHSDKGYMIRWLMYQATLDKQLREAIKSSGTWNQWAYLCENATTLGYER